MPVASSVGSLRFLPLDQSVTTIPAICCSLQLGLFLLSQLPLASSLQYQCFHPHSLSHPTTCVHILFAEHFLGSFQTLTFFLKRSLPKSRIYYCCAPKSGLVRQLRIHHPRNLPALLVASHKVPFARATIPRFYPVESTGDCIDSCYTAFCDAMKHSYATVVHSRSSHA